MTIDQQISALSRRAEKIVPEPDLRKKLQRSADTGKPLRIKLGLDPTAPDITLGHAVPLKIIRQFQDLGHTAVLIIGDYTARVGDPSGRNTTRPVLSGEDIDRNAKTYVAQLGKVLLTDPQHLEVRFNGEWFSKMNLLDILKLTSKKSVAQMLTRDDFQKRYSTGVDIRIHEFLYPLMQGYDSVMIDADVEMGGSDQLFNNLVGRDLQEEAGKPGQAVIVAPLLVGTDGAKKMSKSLGNYIAVTDPPSGATGMFGKIMSLPDHLMDSYYTLLTDLPREQFAPLIQSSPRDAKVALARYIITWLHDSRSADTAEADFLAATHGGIPSDIPELPLAAQTLALPQLLVQAAFVSSISEARRKLKEGAVRLDGNRLSEKHERAEILLEWDASKPNPPLDPGPRLVLHHPFVLQLGKRQFVRVKPPQP